MSSDRPLHRVKDSYGSHPSQFVEYFGDTGVCIGLIHGGYWRDRYGLDLMDELALDLVARGYRVANVEYRRLGQGVHWPTLLDDVLRRAQAARARTAQGRVNPVTSLGSDSRPHQ